MTVCSYTINGYQPVLCTYIGDQPMFYSNVIPDDDSPHDESSSLSTQEKMEQFKENCISLQVIEDSPISFEFVHLSRFLQNMHSYLIDNKVKFLKENYFFKSLYVKETNTIHYTNDRLSLIDAIRDAYLQLTTEILNPLSFYNIDHAIGYNRTLWIDKKICRHRVAYEMKLSGDSSLNDELNTGMEKFHFEDFVEGDFRNLNNGSAMRNSFYSHIPLTGAFKQEDLRIIRAYLGMYEFPSKQYSDEEFAKMIRNIGKVPYGTDYLDKYHSGSVSLLCRVEDRSLSNYAWFIKFEQSFRDYEKNPPAPEPVKNNIIPFKKLDSLFSLC